MGLASAALFSNRRRKASHLSKPDAIANASDQSSSFAARAPSNRSLFRVGMAPARPKLTEEQSPMKVLAVVAALAGVFLSVASAIAQVYPTRTITVIVPVAAGGITDTVARILSDRMKSTLGQAVIVENVTGAGGTIGLARLYRSTPDGYTLMVGQWTSNVGSGAIYPLPFDVLNDFEPISMLSIGPLWIMGSNNLPAMNLRELIAWLKANPDRATAGTIGAGSAAHFVLFVFSEY